jgi:hypothetical protein
VVYPTVTLRKTSFLTIESKDSFLKLICKIEISKVKRKDLENTIDSFIVADVP